MYNGGNADYIFCPKSNITKVIAVVTRLIRHIKAFLSNMHPHVVLWVSVCMNEAI